MSDDDANDDDNWSTDYYTDYDTDTGTDTDSSKVAEPFQQLTLAHVEAAFPILLYTCDLTLPSLHVHTIQFTCTLKPELETSDLSNKYTCYICQDGGELVNSVPIDHMLRDSKEAEIEFVQLFCGKSLKVIVRSVSSGLLVENAKLSAIRN